MSERGEIASTPVDVVVPVYFGLHYVRDLLRSIAAETIQPHRVYVVDDSADDAAHETLLAVLPEGLACVVERNPENVGYGASCNRGAALGNAPFVCFLNSDTLVTPGWLAAIARCFESDPTIAVVNPITNQGANLSVPMPPGYTHRQTAAQIAELSLRRYPDLTTAVGFCMAVRREWFERVGGFDPAFGRGYCEDSDLCMKVTDLGGRVVAADDGFVFHRGEGSFDSRDERYRKNRELFDERWGHRYFPEYAAFLEANPLQYLRDGLLAMTVPAPAWSPGRARVIESALREVAGPLPGAWIHHTPTGLAELDHRPRTPRVAEDREVRYPTRTFLARRPAGKGLSITFLVSDLGRSGGMIEISQLARELLVAGHEVTFATLAAEVHPERLDLPTQPLVFPDDEALVELLPACDVVVATWWETAARWLPPLRARRDFRSVYWVQDFEAWFYPESAAATRAAVEATYGLADERIVVSSWLRGLLAERGMDSTVVPCGIDRAIFRPRHVARADGLFRVACPARPHDERRGLVEAIEAFRLLGDRRSDVEILFYGCEPQELPAALPFRHRVVGRFPSQERVASFLASCDALVDASHYHGFGRPGLEAMACGLATVLTDAGGPREYARAEENALLVRPRRPVQMMRELARLADDPELRRRLGAAGAETAAGFCHLRAAERHLDVYRRLLTP